MSLVEAFTAVFCVFMKYVVSNREVRIVRRQQLRFVFYEWIKLLHHSVLIRREEKKVSDKQIWAARFHYVESTRSNVSDWPSADNVRRERGRTGETMEITERAEVRDTKRRRRVDGATITIVTIVTIWLHLQLRAVNKDVVMLVLMERQLEQTSSQFRGVWLADMDK